MLELVRKASPFVTRWLARVARAYDALLDMEPFPRYTFLQTSVFTLVVVGITGSIMSYLNRPTFFAPGVVPFVPQWAYFTAEPPFLHAVLIAEIAVIAIYASLLQRSVRPIVALGLLGFTLTIFLVVVVPMYKTTFLHVNTAAPSTGNEGGVPALADQDFTAWIKQRCVFGYCPFSNFPSDAMPLGTAIRQTSYFLLLSYALNRYKQSLPVYTSSTILTLGYSLAICSLPYTVIVRTQMGWHTAEEALLGVALGFILFWSFLSLFYYLSASLEQVYSPQTSTFGFPRNHVRNIAVLHILFIPLFIYVSRDPIPVLHNLLILLLVLSILYTLCPSARAKMGPH
jgi:hypothetical protein